MTWVPRPPSWRPPTSRSWDKGVLIDLCLTLYNEWSLCTASSVQSFNQKHEVKHLGETNLTTLFLSAINMNIKDACRAHCHFSVRDFEGNWTTSSISLYCFSCLIFGDSIVRSCRNCAYFSAVWTQNICELTINYATAQYISEQQFCGLTDIQNREKGLVATWSTQLSNNRKVLLCSDILILKLTTSTCEWEFVQRCQH